MNPAPSDVPGASDWEIPEKIVKFADYTGAVHNIPMAVISVLYYLFMLVYSLAYLLIMLAVFVLTVPFDRERLALHRMSAMWARSFFWLNPLWRVRVEGRENVDRKGTYVVTVNHASMLDIPLMYALPGLNFKWVSKRDVYRWPIFGLVLWMHGDIAIDPHSPLSLRRMTSRGRGHLEKGTSVIVFPEGTRSRDGRLGRFRDGAFALAREAGVQVLPCAADGTGRAFEGWRTRPVKYTVRIMPPLSAERVREGKPSVLAAEVREMTEKALTEIRERAERK